MNTTIESEKNLSAPKGPQPKKARAGRELLTLSGQQDFVWSVAWSPDGRKLATASWDKTAKVWDAGTGRELLTLRGHQNLVTTVAWSPGGAKLATAGLEKTAKVWDAGTASSASG